MIHNSVLKILVAATAAVPAWGLASPVGVFTIVDGDVVVIRESSKFTAVEGLHVLADDIVRTTDATRLARIELVDGGALDVGPATQLMLRPRSPTLQSVRPATVYLSQGWLKLTSARNAASGELDFASPRVDLNKLAGNVVARVARDAAFVFVESGAAELVERRDGKAARGVALRDGEAYTDRGDVAGAVTSRPPAHMVQTIPRAFTDSLPLRAALFQSRTVAAPASAEVGYDDVSGWINGEPMVRLVSRQRWSAKAREARFRARLIAELRSHPEWDRVLFPEKYAPKRASVARSGSAAAAPAATVSAAAAATHAVPKAPDPPLGGVPVAAGLAAPDWAPTRPLVGRFN